MIVRTPDGKATTFDYREIAPGKATPTMYLGEDGNIDRSAARPPAIWRRACRAPCAAWRSRTSTSASSPGKTSCMPAAELAEKGFVMSASLARSLNGQLQPDKGAMRPFPASVAAYGKPGGQPWVDGDRIVLTDLAKSSARDRDDGPDAFYTGWIADRIAEDMAANGGLITKADLAAYQAKERAPITSNVPRLRDHLDAAAELGRHGAHRDAEHPRGGRDSEKDARLGRGAASRHRGDAARVSRSRAFPRRSRFRPGAGRAPDLEATRPHPCKVNRSQEGDEQRRARQGHRHSHTAIRA